MKTSPIKLSSDEKFNNQDSENIVPTRGKLTDEDLIFLSNAGKELFEITPEVNIYKFIAVWINRLLKRSFVVASSCNEAQSNLNVRAAAGVGRELSNIIPMLGRNPIGLSLRLDDVAGKGLTRGRLEKVAGGIYELTCGKIPRVLCDSLEGILNISSTYAMGLTWQGKIMGGVAILMRYEDEIKSPRVIETFVNHSAVVLHQRLKWTK